MQTLEKPPIQTLKNIVLSDRAQALAADLARQDPRFAARYREVERDPAHKKYRKTSSYWFEPREARSGDGNSRVRSWIPKLNSPFFAELRSLFEDDRWLTFDDIMQRIQATDPHCGEEYVRKHLAALKAITVIEQSGDGFRESGGCDRFVEIGDLIIESPFRSRYLGMVIDKQNRRGNEILTVQWLSEHPAGTKSLIGAKLAYPVEQWYEKTVATEFLGFKKGKKSHLEEIQLLRNEITARKKPIRRTPQTPEQKLIEALRSRDRITLGQAYEIAGINCDFILSNLRKRGKIEFLATFPRSVRWSAL